ncbi:M23 family metallopeptidase [Phenylobacterium aquaticum]|uniref:M23 family metallopeptidase n=1 Tax=Phenylobacterium aquaticum TaxID=1763816 RepID=UPI001F5DDDB1|nr:M23 family metallopeptidase [Phenylobacterium aquaticum]MCI3131117.1 M23 family metallopeptidase [Phenylobacterium aquaticum]
MGRTAPRAQIFVDDVAEGLASQAGYFVVGFDRDAGPEARIRVVTEDGEATHVAVIAPGDFNIQRIDGLPEDQVAPQDEALLARIAAEVERKSKGFASLADLDDFRQGFITPVKTYRLSARFGGQRILNGEPKKPHYGDDLAAPVGTPIRAPAGGVVSFAETGLHFDGGLTLIDHGQGLITCYLHQSRIDVAVGDTVRRGQVIGAVGKEGRATGPHLCWRMKWHGRNLDPMLMVGAKQP